MGRTLRGELTGWQRAIGAVRTHIIRPLVMAIGFLDSYLAKWAGALVPQITDRFTRAQLLRFALPHLWRFFEMRRLSSVEAMMNLALQIDAEMLKKPMNKDFAIVYELAWEFAYGRRS